MSGSQLNVSFADLLAEYERAAKGNESGAQTVKEWAKAWGVSTNRARNLISYAVEEKRMEVVPISRKSILRPGHCHSTYGFRFVVKKK
jgi:hypothetical protein